MRKGLLLTAEEVAVGRKLMWGAVSAQGRGEQLVVSGGGEALRGRRAALWPVSASPPPIYSPHLTATNFI